MTALRDWQFWAALVAAPIFWALLYGLGSAPVDAVWPLAQPVRFLLPALIYPVLEEIVFRGGLQPWIARQPWGAHRVAGISYANALTSVLFSALHFLFHPPLWAALVLVPSLVFGYFRERHDSLASPIMLHVFYNAGYFWIFGV